MYLGITIGSVVGGYLASWFGAGWFSYTSVLISGVGSIIGFLIGYKLTNL